MDRNECISALIAAGMTWTAAANLFHNQLAWRPEHDRRFLVEHYCELAREEARLQLA